MTERFPATPGAPVLQDGLQVANGDFLAAQNSRAAAPAPTGFRAGRSPAPARPPMRARPVYGSLQHFGETVGSNSRAATARAPREGIARFSPTPLMPRTRRGALTSSRSAPDARQPRRAGRSQVRRLASSPGRARHRRRRRRSDCLLISQTRGSSRHGRSVKATTCRYRE